MYVTLLLSYFLNLGRACLFVSNIKKLFFYKYKKNFHNKNEMNMPQAEGNVNSFLYSRGAAQTNCMKNMMQEKFKTTQQ